mmetsp:Transcript_10010/g.17157  ORF Transcript_10010/g.17157 Transcript_10010/m.17157 type:complete len:207 (+) Transcript_10010:296-916(+)
MQQNQAQHITNHHNTSNKHDPLTWIPSEVCRMPFLSKCVMRQDHTRPQQMGVYDPSRRATQRQRVIQHTRPSQLFGWDLPCHPQHLNQPSRDKRATWRHPHEPRVVVLQTALPTRVLHLYRLQSRFHPREPAARILLHPEIQLPASCGVLRPYRQHRKTLWDRLVLKTHLCTCRSGYTPTSWYLARSLATTSSRSTWLGLSLIAFA